MVFKLDGVKVFEEEQRVSFVSRGDRNLGDSFKC